MMHFKVMMQATHQSLTMQAQILPIMHRVNCCQAHAQNQAATRYMWPASEHFRQKNY